VVSFGEKKWFSFSGLRSLETSGSVERRKILSPEGFPRREKEKAARIVGDCPGLPKSAKVDRDGRGKPRFGKALGELLRQIEKKM